MTKVGRIYLQPFWKRMSVYIHVKGLFSSHGYTGPLHTAWIPRPLPVLQNLCEQFTRGSILSRVDPFQRLLSLTSCSPSVSRKVAWKDPRSCKGQCIAGDSKQGTETVASLSYLQRRQHEGQRGRSGPTRITPCVDLRDVPWRGRGCRPV